MQKFIPQIEAGFVKRHVANKIYKTYDAKAVTDEVNREIIEFEPEIIIHVMLKKGMVYDGIDFNKGRGMNAADFDIRIVDFPGNDIVWKGEMSAYGSYGLSMAATKTAQRLFSTFERDKIVPAIR